MDLDKRNFFAQLGRILQSLLYADFVSIDFELSGIPTKVVQTVSEHSGSEVRIGKPTLQERYTETKIAAEKYHILQVGITIAVQSKEAGGYILRPFNMHLDPCVVEKMDIDREINLLSSSIQFLLKSNFQIEKPFTEGIPYLSRAEHRRAIQLERERLEGYSIPDIRIAADDSFHESFLQRVRATLKEWEPKNKDDALIITAGIAPIQLPLDGYQRRLVHQLVRAEFQEYVSVTSGSRIKVIPFNAERESKVKKAKMEAFFQRVSKQVGFRWILEGLVGGDLTDLDPVPLFIGLEESVGWLDMNKVHEDMAELCNGLKACRPVLVGHNMFTDLIYMYKTFFGPLPEKVEDFAKAIHNLFPVLVDTKFLATHHGVVSNSSLDELVNELAEDAKPEIYTHPGHQKYESINASHEAGYDSWQTARILIKLARRLANERIWASTLSGRESSHKEPTTTMPEAVEDAKFPDMENPSSAAFSAIGEQASRIHSPVDSQAKMERSPVGSERPNNIFTLLPDPVEAEATDPSDLSESGEAEGPAAPRWTPQWRSDFWLHFGNQIRVNGTQEGILNLAA